MAAEPVELLKFTCCSISQISSGILAAEQGRAALLLPSICRLIIRKQGYLAAVNWLKYSDFCFTYAYNCKELNCWITTTERSPMLLITSLLFVVLGWACLYGLCSILTKFWKINRMFLFCSLTGLAVGLALIAVVWLIFCLNFEKYPEQGEGTLWILYFIGYPLSLIVHLITIYESLVVTFLAILNWGMFGMSVGLVKNIFMRKIIVY